MYCEYNTRITAGAQCMLIHQDMTRAWVCHHVYDYASKSGYIQGCLV